MKTPQSSRTNLDKIQPSKFHLLRVILLVTIILNAFCIQALIEISQAFKRWLPSSMWNLVIGVSIGTLVAGVVFLVLSWTAYRGAIPQALRTVTTGLSRLRAFNLVILGLLVALHGFFVFGPIGQHTRDLSTFAFSFWIVSLLSGILLKAWSLNQPKDFQMSWSQVTLYAMLITASGHVISAALARITNYPFTSTWSETSRYYYASLFFSERIYGVRVPLPALHPSEYLVLSIPYLLPKYSLVIHRAWQYFLVIAMPLITAYILSRRLGLHRLRRIFFILWVFLYLSVGPVYYHLLLPVILILWGYDSNRSHPNRWRILKTFILVALASIWAGISRVNWIPVPGLLAATLYLLEVPLAGAIKDSAGRSESPHANQPSSRSIIKYLAEPVLWVFVGTLFAILSYGVYILISGNPIQYFATTYTSSLLLYRLLPNPTYPPGVLTGTLMVSLPLILICIAKLTERTNSYSGWQAYHRVRTLSLGGILLILFSGGLIVSTKVGGGSNLHNMDAFMLTLLVVTALIYYNQSVPDYSAQRSLTRDQTLNDQKLSQKLQNIGLTLSVIVVVVFNLISYAPPFLIPLEKEVNRSVQAVNKYIQAANETGSHVLFISNRHLIPFNYRQEIQLLPDYERVFLMEMAMAGDEDYLNQFYDDLRNQRFDLIIVEPLYDQIKGGRSPFGEENDIWVERVSKPILCYYEEQRTLRLVNIQILSPKEQVGVNCP